MKVILKSNALELDAQLLPASQSFSFEHKMWRESISEMLKQGGKFDVHTSCLSADSFTVFQDDFASIELPDYMIESVIDDARIGNCAKITIKEDALKINEDRLPTSELISYEYENWRNSISELLQSGREFDVRFQFDEKFYISSKDGSPLEIHDCMIESFLMTDRASCRSTSRRKE